MAQPFIFIVDDAFETRRTLVATFESLDCRVAAAASAEEAYNSIVGSPPPDVLVLDFILPGESGPQLARRLFHHPELRNIKIVPFTSTMARNETAADNVLRDYGMGDGVVRRPENQPIVSKGSNDKISGVPAELIVAVATALGRANVPLSDKLRQRLRETVRQFE